MTIDPAKKYRTRSGLEVRNVRRISDMCKYQFDAEIDDGYWTTRFYTANGSWHDDDIEHDYDLIELKEPSMQSLDWTKPELLQRRDGGEWRLLATDIFGEQPIALAIKGADSGEWFTDLVSADGSYYREHDSESIYDIIPKPRRVTGWCNAYGNEPDRALGPVYRTQEEAKQAALTTVCIGQIYIDAEVQQ